MRQTVFHGILKDVESHNLSAGVMSAILGITGPTVLILGVANDGRLTDHEILSWIMAVYIVGGLFSVILPAVLKKPVTGAHSLMGVAFIVTVAGYYPYSELIGAYLVSAVLIFLVGITGVYSTFMNWIPVEVISAMLAGVITTYVIHLVSALELLPLVGVAAVVGYLVCARFLKRVPPIIGAMTMGGSALIVSGSVGKVSVGHFAVPIATMPSWTWQSIFSIAVPLSILILSNDITPGIGALRSFGFNPPTRMLVSYSGIASAVSAVLGGQSANVAGMMSAICAGDEAGPFDKRYMASIVSGTLLVAFGLLGWMVLPVIEALPRPFISILAGLSLLTPLRSSLRTAFTSNRHWISPVATYAVALSGVSFHHISSTVWALATGFFIALFLERDGKRIQKTANDIAAPD